MFETEGEKGEIRAKRAFIKRNNKRARVYLQTVNTVLFSVIFVTVQITLLYKCPELI